MREIVNKDLMLSNIPNPDASWDEIEEFALTFDGYNVWGSFDRCAEIANSRSHESLKDLRTCLFFEQAVAAFRRESRRGDNGLYPGSG